MLQSSLGGAVASRVSVHNYRHALVRLLIPQLEPLAAGPGWSPLSLALASVLMSWDPSPTLAQRFASTLALLDTALPRRRRTGRTYQGFIKALRRHGEHTIVLLCDHLRTLTRRAAEKAKCWTFGEFVPMGADGSKFDVPRTADNDSLGVAGKDKSGPQMMTLLLEHLGVMLPWAWKAGGARTSERALLRDSLDLLPDNTLLVTDAGFTGYELLKELLSRKIHFLVRVGRGTHLLKELGYHKREGKNTVYLWPDAKCDQPPLVLRLIRLGRMYLITDVTDPRRLSRATASELYRRRWRLEVAFRSLKQTLEHRKMRSGAAINAMMELDWSIMGLWVLSLIGVRSIVAAGHPPGRFSLAGALAAVRAARIGSISDSRLRQRLRAAVQDNYKRKGSKKAYEWPHKKRQKPPGKPSLTKATRTQVRQAKQLRAKKTAE